MFCTSEIHVCRLQKFGQYECSKFSIVQYNLCMENVADKDFSELLKSPLQTQMNLGTEIMAD